jgi:hypothetical protein
MVMISGHDFLMMDDTDDLKRSAGYALLVDVAWLRDGWVPFSLLCPPRYQSAYTWEGQNTWKK